MPPSDARLLTGDCIQQLRHEADASFDAIVTDPPYELGLMGMKWDSTGIAYSAELWRECLRVLKPGGHLLAFGGTRTYHRMTCAIEDAGFEIRDSIHWIYGNGFPKSTDISKAIDRRRNDRDDVLRITRFVREARDRAGKTNAQIDAHLGTRGMSSHWTSQGCQPAVPSAEQWAKLKGFLAFGDEMDAEVARLNAQKGTPGEGWLRRAVTGRYAKVSAGQNWRTTSDPRRSSHARPSERRDIAGTDTARKWQGWGTTLKPAHEPIVVARKPLEGRIADNVLRYGTGGLHIDACRVGTDSTRRSTTARPTFHTNSIGSTSERTEAAYETGSESGRWPTNVIFDEEAARELDAQAGVRTSGKRITRGPRANRGGCASPTTLYPSRVCYADTGGASRFFYVPRASPAERNAGLGEGRNTHMTVKPIALMRYLVRLITPPGGIVLDPFTGSGTTGIAAVLEGARFVGIEREPEYVAIAEARIAHWKGKEEVRRAA